MSSSWTAASYGLPRKFLQVGRNIFFKDKYLSKCLFCPGTSFYPWSGEVVALPEADQDEGKDLQINDPRLQYGVMDNGTGSNFVKYLPPCDQISQTNILAHCGSLGK